MSRRKTHWIESLPEAFLEYLDGRRLEEVGGDHSGHGRHVARQGDALA